MKTEPLPRLGIVDALSVGLTRAGRKPWLVLIPALLDLILWLGPRVSLAPLVNRLVTGSDALFQMAYTPDQMAQLAPVLDQWHQQAHILSAHVNLAEVMTGGWLGAPSVLATGQVTRLSFASDLLLGQTNLAAFPGRPAPIEISSIGGLLLALAGFWLIGQFVVACYLRLASQRRSVAAEAPRPGLLSLAARLVAFSILIAVVVAVLEGLLTVALFMVNVSGSSPLSVLALMFAGVILWLTLWFLLALFFVNEALVLEGQPVLRSITLSIRLVNTNLASALGLIALINLIMYGFRVIWGLIGVTPAGAAVAILCNAFLSTGMLLGTFAFYASLRRASAVPERAKVAN